MRTVRGRITWLAILTSFAFLAAAVIWFVSMRNQTRMLNTYDRGQRIIFGRKALQLREKPIHLAIEKIGIWADLSRFVAGQKGFDQVWADLYLRKLLNSDLRATWVFDAKGKEIYSAGLEGLNPREADFKPDAKELVKMSRRSGPAYVGLRDGTAQIFATSIYAAEDTSQTKSPIGYIAFGSVIDDAALEEMGRAIGATVTFEAKPALDQTSDENVHWLTVSNYAGMPAGALRINWFGNPALLQIDSIRTTSMSLIAAFAALFVLVIVLALTRWVSEPLRGIYLGLATKDPPAIRAAASELDEFKSLADALCESVIQRERLKEWNNELESHVKERTHELQKALMVRGHFLANVSHELRTPLNGVIGMAHLLNDTGLSDEQREYAEAIVGSGEQLLVLINDLLDFEKAAAGKLTVERIPLSVDTCLARIQDSFRARAAQRGITLLVTCDPSLAGPILGDPVRITQILNNLVGNAIKFTEEGVVEVWAGIESGLVTLQVSDTGIGIPQDRLTTIFEAFEQADLSTTRKFGGTGLGLAIVRQLCDLMGGVINVTSVVGEGSTFTVRLPYVPAASALSDAA